MPTTEEGAGLWRGFVSEKTKRRIGVAGAEMPEVDTVSSCGISRSSWCADSAHEGQAQGIAEMFTSACTSCSAAWQHGIVAVSKASTTKIFFNNFIGVY